MCVNASNLEAFEPVEGLSKRLRSLRKKEKFMAEKFAGEFYCVKCKAKRETEGDVVISENGRRMAKGICPVCGTKLNRILGKA